MKMINDVKKMNKIAIARCIYRNQEVTKQEIANALGYSMPTVFQNIKDLIKEGIVCEVGQIESTGGRKAMKLSIVGEAGYAIGLDITKHHIHLVLLNLKGDLLDQQRIRYLFQDKAESYHDLGEQIDALIKHHGIEKDRILGVGVSIPGVVDQKNLMLRQSHVLHLQNLDLRKFAHTIPYELYFTNDANSAAYAEVHNMRKDNLVYLALNHSVGGAICHKGEIQLGDSNKCGEFGHMTLIPDGQVCYCGMKGCVDAYLSARLLLDQSEDDLDVFFEKLEAKDATCHRIWETYLDHLAIEINNLRMIFDCDIILGGYIGCYLEPYLISLSERIAARNPFETGTAYISIGECKKEAGAIGAAVNFIDRYFE